MKHVGVISRGIVTPIFKQGDDLVNIVVDSLLEAARSEDFELHDKDVVGVTESVVARTQGNYATVDQIAEDVRRKFNGEDFGIVFPILSRNRFAILLRAFSRACNKLYVQLSFPYDEVGNVLVSREAVDANPPVSEVFSVFTEEKFREIFGHDTVHPFTGIDYIDYYKSLGDNIEIIVSNDPIVILNYTTNVINCDIHSRKRTKDILQSYESKVFSLDDILTSSVDGSGYNETYGLLGSNKATEELVKLFPRNCQEFVDNLQKKLHDVTGKHIEVMIYGDGGFKDPVGGIWELADPVISPAYTSGLVGTPNELKMKYFADNELGHLSGEELSEAMKNKIREKDSDLKGNMNSEGTTPRQLTDLLGSLCDLTSGSGDRGTPVVLIQNYFTNFASE